MDEKIINAFYRLEWSYKGKWMKLGETTKDIIEIMDTKKVLSDRSEEAGRGDKFRIIRVLEMEVE